MEYANENEFVVIALRRSGQHAIIKWLRSLMKGEVRCINNVTPGKNPYRHIKSPCAKKARQRQFDKVDYLIYNYEHRNLIAAARKPRCDKMVGMSKNIRHILILRDPFNNAASLKRHGVLTGNFPKIWKRYAHEFLGHTNKLYNKVCVNYNKWCYNGKYRAKISKTLGLENGMRPYVFVPRAGNGSSFDKRRYNGYADRMDLFGRWQYYKNSAGFKALFDDEVFELYSKIFPPLHGIEELYDSKS